VAKQTRAARRSRAGAAGSEAPAPPKARGRVRAAASVPEALQEEARTAITNFAEELGHLLGAAQAKATMWLEQRKLIAEQLRGVRDTATRLMRQLGIEVELPAVRSRKPAVAAASDTTPRRRRRRRRRLSAETRRKMSEAAKARWAERKKQEG